MEQLLKALAETDAKLEAILEAAIKDARDLTDEDRANIAALEKERGRLEAQIEFAKKIAANADQRARLTAEETARRAQAERDERRGVGAARLLDHDLPTGERITIKRGEDEQKAAAADRVPTAIIRRNGVPKHFRRGTVAERQERAYRFGMFGLALLSMDIGGRFRNRMAEDWLEANMTVHQSNNATGAHILIPEEFSADMIDLRERYGVARRLLKAEPMTSDTKTVPRRVSGLTAYFVAEGAAGTESNKTWNDVRLTAKDLMVISRWSNQVDADSVINFGDDLANEISYAFSIKEDQCAFIGTGTSTYGGISGVVTQMGAAGVQTQGTGNTWGAIVLADFNSMVGLLPQYADTPDAAWVCHKTFYHGVMQKLELAAGGVTALEVSSGDRRPRPLFLGYPVEFSQVMPSATAVATIAALLGDYSLAGLFGDRQQESIAFSQEANVNGESLFERNQLAIRGTQRFDINIHDVGSATAVGPVVALKTGP